MFALRLAVVSLVASAALSGAATLMEFWFPLGLLALGAGAALGRAWRRSAIWPTQTPFITRGWVLLLGLFLAWGFAGAEALSNASLVIFNSAFTVWLWPGGWTRRFRAALKRLHGRLPRLNRAIPLLPLLGDLP